MPTRADRIEEILRNSRGRLPVPQIVHDLATIEGGDEDALNASVSATVRQDNQGRVKRGQAKRFRVFERDGGGDEERGFISLVASPEASQTDEERIAELVDSANSQVRVELRKYIEKLTWQEFESVFLPQLLEALGFQDITITQPTKDGGQDALCTYKMGIVSHEAIVSAKHWNRQNVGPAEVQQMRGIVSDADTGIIVTSSNFTSGAVSEAEKRTPGYRTVILINGDLIVQTCIKEGLGVQEVELPKLFRFKAPSLSDDE